MLYLTYQKLQTLIHETEKSLSPPGDKLKLGLTAKIRILAETMCQYPFRVLVVRNGLDYRRTVLSSVTVSSRKDLDALVLLDTDLELYSVCYDAPENRIVVNYREKYSGNSLS